MLSASVDTHAATIVALLTIGDQVDESEATAALCESVTAEMTVDVQSVPVAGGYEVSVDTTPLICAALRVTHRLVHMVAESTGRTAAEVVAELGMWIASHPEATV